MIACSPQQRSMQGVETLCGEIALNPYKQDIFPDRRVIKSSLVGYGIHAMKGALNNE
jgi:hypothetical protein